MPRQARHILPGVPLHVVQRGIDRQRCFRGESDFLRYWQLLAQHGDPSDCAIHAYVLMSNHVHLLLTPRSGIALPALMKALGQQYAQYFNRCCQRTGPLWESRYRAHIVQDDAHLLTCQRYIELNPVRAGMCANPAAYPWSSFRGNALGQRDNVLIPHRLFESLGRSAYLALFDRPMRGAQVEAIRACTTSGRPFGQGLSPEGTVPRFLARDTS